MATGLSGAQEFCFPLQAGHHYQIHHTTRFRRCESPHWYWITDDFDGGVVAGEPPTNEQLEFGVIPVTNNLYSILRSSCTASRSVDELKAVAYSDANTFCTKLGKRIQPASFEATEPSAWHTFVTGEGNEVEFQFHCLTE
jgi:hypothetical protein